MEKESKQRPAPWKSLVAGGVAGSIEAFCTYPAEFAKTRLQLQKNEPGVAKVGPTAACGLKAYKQAQSPIALLRSVVRESGIRGVYQGCSTLIVGTAVKAGVRFLTFDAIRKQFADERGQVSAVGGVVSGFGAGLIESIVAVTPFETIKTALIDDAKRGKDKRYNGFIQGTRALYSERGFGGIYRGLVPVTMRQCANSAVRMGAYSYLSGAVRRYKDLSPTSKLPGTITFGIGAIAGIITVYATMPFDTVKTRMQSLEAKNLYKSTFDCALKVLRNEGVLVFWSGAVPRLARLIFSGGIVFSVYEQVMAVLV